MTGIDGSGAFQDILESLGWALIDISTMNPETKTIVTKGKAR